ncbi:MAG: glycosyltransferase [Prevotella sp.]|jgi:glycosyltransferase involved in cell wall biosynthesis|nr:glycosyltransferase [Prevotella sp.]
MDNPLISIIVPIYKVEKYLPKCVESIVHQTYKNLEIILVDDGSPDRCGKMCDEYAAKDNRIKVIHKQNGGLSDARNIAIDIAKGEYITFVDSDDYVKPNYVETLYNLIKKYQCMVSIVNPIVFDEYGHKKHIFSSDSKEYCWSADEAVEKMFYQKMFDTSAWGKLYHYSLFTTGIRYPKGLLFEDLPTTYRLFFQTNKIAFKSIELYNYLIRKNSIEGSKFSPQKIESAIKIIDSFEKNKDLLLNIKRAYNCRILSFCFHVFLKIPSDCQSKDRLYKLIKERRFRVMLNHNARIKTRLACFLSYLCPFILNRVFQLIDRR